MLSAVEDVMTTNSQAERCWSGVQRGSAVGWCRLFSASPLPLVERDY